MYRREYGVCHLSRRNTSMFNFFKKQQSITGIDIIDVSRFEQFRDSRDNAFLQKTFFKEELDYCFAFKDPSEHLAGTFAAKEAVSKALGVMVFPFAEIMILRDKHGKPEAWNKERKLPVSVSITHTDTLAAAIAVA